MTNNNPEPLTKLPEGIENWKGYRRILDIIVDSVSDEIMELVEFLNDDAGITNPAGWDESPQELIDDFYEKYEEPVEELIWKKICESLNPLPDQERI